MSYGIVSEGDNIASVVLKSLGCLVEPGVSFYMMRKVIFRVASDTSRVSFIKENLYSCYSGSFWEA